MKKINNLNILFISNLSSIHFAWHFLNYANIYSFQEQQLTNETEKLTIKPIQKLKQYKELNCVVCLQDISVKKCEEIVNNISPKTQVITNNISCYLKFKQLKVEVIYITIQQFKDKTTIFALNNLTDIFNSNISIKINKQIISNQLSQHIINCCIGSLCYNKKQGLKHLFFNYSKKRRIVKLMEECIKLTNSVMLTCNNYEGFNFYHFLSGKGLTKKIKQYFQLFVLLNKLKKHQYKKEEIIESVNQLTQLNFLNYCELNHLTKISEELNK